jgi:hypothetical protein
MALDTIPKQEGGKLKAVASGTLPSGQPVVVNSDGTVSVISQTTTSGTETLGTQFALPTTSGQQASFLGGTYDSVNQKAIITYRDVNNSSYGTAVVGTVGENSVTWGTPVVFESAQSQWTSCAFDSTNGKVVISYQDQANSFYGTSIVGTVSGNSISFGTPVVFQSSETTYIDTTYDVSAGAIVVNYSGAGLGGGVVAGTVSGTSITFGSTVQFGGTGIYGRAVYHPEEQCTIIAWRDNSPSTRGSAIALTVSGTTITLGTRVYYLGAGQANQNDIAYDSDSKKIVIICRDEVNTTYGSSIVGTVSGTTLTFASPVTFQSGSVDWMGIEGWFTGGVVMTYDDQSSGNKIILKYGTISGTTISWGTGLEVYSGTGNNGYTGWSMATDVGRLVLAYNANSDGKYRVYNPTFTSTSTNLTSENYIGMSGGAIEVTGSAAFVGTPVVFENADTRFPAATFDSNSNKVVIAYRDQGNSEYGTAIVGTVSGTSISFGTPAVFNSAAIEYMSPDSIVFDSNSNKVVICYKNGGNSNYGTAIVGTVSGTNISFGTAAVFESATTASISAAFDSNSNKVVIAYKAVSPETATAIVGTVSSTSISFGSKVVFSTGAPTATAQTFDSSNNKVIIVYWDEGNSKQGTAIVGTVSGTGISFGSETVFETSTLTKNGKGLTASFNPNAGKVVVAYTDVSDSNYGKALVGTVSGTSISFGTAATFETASSTEFDSVYDASSQSVIIAYKDEGNSSAGTSVAAFISGTSISFSSPTVFEADRTDEVTLTYDSFNNKTVAAYQNAIDSNDGTAVVFSPSTVSATRGQVADGDNATIDIVGTVSTNQVGLTAGQQYYVQTDGTIGTTPADPSVLAGTAVSATKMVVKS